MLPKAVYELLPYACLMTAIYVVISINDPIAYVSGALFYIAGSSIWIKRSTFRRDQRAEQAKGRTYVKTRRLTVVCNLPESVYEAMPFVYIAAGVAAVILIPSDIGYLFALLLGSAGGLIISLRSSNRKG